MFYKAQGCTQTGIPFVYTPLVYSKMLAHQNVTPKPDKCILKAKSRCFKKLHILLITLYSFSFINKAAKIFCTFPEMVTVLQRWLPKFTDNQLKQISLKFGLRRMYSLFKHDVHVYEVFVFFFEKAHLNQVPSLKGPHQTAVESTSIQDRRCDWLSKIRMHSSRMRTVRNSSRLLLGGVSTPRRGADPPGADPWSRQPPEQTPWGAGTPRGPVARHAGIPSAMYAGIAHPSGDLLQGMLGYHLQGMLGYHPLPLPWTDTHL